METIAQFNDNSGLNVKLTEDKIYVSGGSGDETFALRSVNGVGTYDNIDKFAEENEAFDKAGGGWKWGFRIFGFIMIPTLLRVVEEPDSVAALVVIGGIAGLCYYKWKNAKANPPILDSYLKFMISGNERMFKFNKSNESSATIADFINKIEDTLTAYNK